MVFAQDPDPKSYLPKALPPGGQKDKHTWFRTGKIYTVVGPSILQTAPSLRTLGLVWTTQSLSLSLGVSDRASNWLTASLDLFTKAQLLLPHSESGSPRPRAEVL